MAIKEHEDFIQGSEEWFNVRRGLLTASEMKLIITPANLKPANNEKVRTHLYELAAQRITGYTEPSYVGDDMLRGRLDEIEAREIYSENYAEVREIGFVTNDKWGFTLGYSPDGLVGDDGQIEAKSRKQKYQIQTILEGAMPDDFAIQVQTGLAVTERKWCDFITFSGGLPMMTLRVFPDPVVQKAIIEAAAIFHGQLEKRLAEYRDLLASDKLRLIPTIRKVEEEITPSSNAAEAA